MSNIHSQILLTQKFPFVKPSLFRIAKLEKLTLYLIFGFNS